MDMKRRPYVVGLIGYAGAGKSTVAEYLCRNYQFTTVKMAKPLKDMFRVLGLRDEHLEGHLKNVPTKILNNQTPRFALQTVGEYFKEIFGQTFWSDRWVEAAEQHIFSHKSSAIVIDDVRFPWEVDAIRRISARAEIWKIDDLIDRDGDVFEHVSETSWKRIACDLTVINEKNLPIKVLYRGVDAAMARY